MDEIQKRIDEARAMLDGAKGELKSVKEQSRAMEEEAKARIEEINQALREAQNEMYAREEEEERKRAYEMYGNSDLSMEIHDLAYSRAYRDAHSDGYSYIADVFGDYMDFAEEIVNVIR